MAQYVVASDDTIDPPAATTVLSAAERAAVGPDSHESSRPGAVTASPQDEDANAPATVRAQIEIEEDREAVTSASMSGRTRRAAGLLVLVGLTGILWTRMLTPLVHRNYRMTAVEDAEGPTYRQARRRTLL